MKKKDGAKRQRSTKRESSDAADAAEAGQGRQEEAQWHAVRMMWWRISEAGIPAFPATAEFMHSQELKKTLS